MLKFDRDFKVCCSFRVELKALNETKYSMFGVSCAFGNVYCLLAILIGQKGCRTYQSLWLYTCVLLRACVCVCVWACVCACVLEILIGAEWAAALCLCDILCLWLYLVVCLCAWDIDRGRMGSSTHQSLGRPASLLGGWAVASCCLLTTTNTTNTSSTSEFRTDRPTPNK